MPKVILLSTIHKTTSDHILTIVVASQAHCAARYTRHLSDNKTCRFLAKHVATVKFARKSTSGSSDGGYKSTRVNHTDTHIHKLSFSASDVVAKREPRYWRFSSFIVATTEPKVLEIAQSSHSQPLGCIFFILEGSRRIAVAIMFDIIPEIQQ